jgi:hypothetical protein
MREGMAVWVATVVVGSLPLWLRLAGNVLDPDPNGHGWDEFWDLDLFAQDLLLLCLVTCCLGLVTCFSKYNLLRAKVGNSVELPNFLLLIMIIFLGVLSAFSYAEAAGVHAHTIWFAGGLTGGTLVGSLSLEVKSVAMAL